MYTIGQLVKEFGLSRSTLLFYDKIGLLKPSERTNANYRLYSQADFDRMVKIARYRDAGLSLEAIADILKSNENDFTNILEQRLESLNCEISTLRAQQQAIIKMLGDKALPSKSKNMNVEQWVKILESCGMDDNAQREWHINFENDLPEAHTDFLQSLGIDEQRIKEIKSWK
ncbi:MerR family transcriptional regulator [Pseudemcibacter aquimaris]|uniref:MerR family transcriptional regulator n=1 Tax=Pseudemcibacter aquimaris TaxID=2857064 RepID=UPI002010E131|nr:MerR family transcriptional regulator [Pseudemcibacter aquimaris]MCC3860025.1 MerR family transcriptional regulator [Pseudemcibacter aquimaris]WDU57355.1 MerR family transcriptional regulator [Pseudemcibacter aquimaris]